MAIGSLLLAPLPGPGWGTFFVGLGMVAGEVLQVARLLDRAEVVLKEALRGAKVVWGRSAPWVRVLIALMLCVSIVASVYGAYHVLPGVLESGNELGRLAIGQLVDLPL